MSRFIFVYLLLAVGSVHAQDIDSTQPVSEIAEYLEGKEPESKGAAEIYSFLFGVSNGYASATTRMLTLMQIEAEYIPDFTECAPDPDAFFDRLVNVEADLAEMPLGSFAAIVMIQSCEAAVIDSLRRRQQGGR